MGSRKLRKFLLAIAVVVAGTMMLASCDNDEALTPPQEESVVTENLPAHIEVIDSGRISRYEHYSNMLKLASQGNSEEDKQIAAFAAKQLALNDSIIDANLQKAGGNSLHGEDGPEGKNRIIGYKWVTIRYQSIGADGNPIILSELIAYPYNNVLPNPNPDNLIIGCHVTITSNAERPTNYGNNSIMTDVGMMATHATSNAVTCTSEALVVIPDYEGYGATHGNAHPYLYQSVTARQVIDGALAAQTWFEANEKKMDDGWKSVSLGYSQGGSVAMAVHRYIEEHNLSSRLHFAGSICGDGPYDPIATVKSYIQDGRVYMPVALALILKGICDVNPHVKGKFAVSDYLTQEFLDTGIMDMIEKKAKTTDEIQYALAYYSWAHKDGFVLYGKLGDQYLRIKDEYGVQIFWFSFSVNEPMGAYAKIEDVLRPEVIEYFSNGTADNSNLPKCKALYEALSMNVLTNGWRPSHPMAVFHSTIDEVVPFVNYESARINFGSDYFRGIKYQTRTHTHVSTGSAFFAWYEADYMAWIFKDKLLERPVEYIQTGLLW